LPAETYSKIKGVDLILTALFLGRVVEWRREEDG
jgi:hypothetical protein